MTRGALLRISRSCRSFCGSRNQISRITIQWGCVWICLVSRLPQRSFVYLVSVYVLDPNLPPVATPLIRFENGVLGIVRNYFGGLFSARSFDFPSHMRSPLVRPRLRLSLAIPYSVRAETACHRICDPHPRWHLRAAFLDTCSKAHRDILRKKVRLFCRAH
jgi:hypothetical protein